MSGLVCTEGGEKVQIVEYSYESHPGRTGYRGATLQINLFVIFKYKLQCHQLLFILKCVH